MWHVLSESVVGTSHSSKSSPCQDACTAKVIRVDGHEFLVIAIADGAGSASHSEIGADLATKMVLEQAEQHFQSFPTDLPSELQIREWYAAVRDRLVAESQFLDISPRALACTLLVSVVGDKSSIFAQLGDGVFVYRMNGKFSPVIWPQSGEYVNTTNFLTDEHYANELVFAEVAQRLDCLAGMTDGLQPLAIDYSTKLGVTGFFQPFFDRLRTCDDVSSLSQPLRTLLASPKINDRTDDDKSLVLALWVEPRAAQDNC